MSLDCSTWTKLNVDGKPQPSWRTQTIQMPNSDYRTPLMDRQGSEVVWLGRSPYIQLSVLKRYHVRPIVTYPYAYIDSWFCQVTCQRGLQSPFQICASMQIGSMHMSSDQREQHGSLQQPWHLYLLGLRIQSEVGRSEPRQKQQRISKHIKASPTEKRTKPCVQHNPLIFMRCFVFQGPLQKHHARPSVPTAGGRKLLHKKSDKCLGTKDRLACQTSHLCPPVRKETSPDPGLPQNQRRGCQNTASTRHSGVVRQMTSGHAPHQGDSESFLHSPCKSCRPRGSSHGEGLRRPTLKRRGLAPSARRKGWCFYQGWCLRPTHVSHGGPWPNTWLKGIAAAPSPTDVGIPIGLAAGEGNLQALRMCDADLQLTGKGNLQARSIPKTL